MDLGIVLATNHHKYNHMSHNILTLSTYQQRIASLHPNINLQTIDIIYISEKQILQVLVTSTWQLWTSDPDL